MSSRRLATSARLSAWLLVGTVVLLAAGAPWSTPAQAETGRAGQASSRLRPYVGTRVDGRVVSVTDGDTVRVRLDNGVTVIVRLEGIDAPERGEPFSRDARNAVRVLLLDRRVTVRGTDVDRYDRLVARVLVDNVDSSIELVSRGLACHFTRYSADARLASAQAVARKDGRGFWATGAPRPQCTTFAGSTSPPRARSGSSRR